MFYLTTHSTHFIYGYMATDIWLLCLGSMQAPKTTKENYMQRHPSLHCFVLVSLHAA